MYFLEQVTLQQYEELQSKSLYVCQNRSSGDRRRRRQNKQKDGQQQQKKVEKVFKKKRTVKTAGQGRVREKNTGKYMMTLSAKGSVSSPTVS